MISPISEMATLACSGDIPSRSQTGPGSCLPYFAALFGPLVHHWLIAAARRAISP
ncbi:hypothetical protein [Saccharopolyspora sp. NPDC050642]|uniref:hypothetical protein n=1 Tax=Saccharopolyspora sp. NPDC050642 TaxID=3157099 RepID=UPI0033F5AA99